MRLTCLSIADLNPSKDAIILISALILRARIDSRMRSETYLLSRGLKLKEVSKCEKPLQEATVLSHAARATNLVGMLHHLHLKRM